MCLITFQLQEHPVYKLILASNRDESYERPTAAASFWQDYPYILAGRDLLQKGTWLGITKAGRFAALTNVHDHSRKLPTHPVSRGKIIKDYLISNQPASVFLANLQKNQSNYVGFNLLVGDIDHFWHFNNLTNQITSLPSGMHGLSNAGLNDPWPKVVKGKAYIQDFSSKHEPASPSDLLTAFADTTTVSNKNEVPWLSTEDPIEFESQNSQIFIKTPKYGTVSTTILLVDHNNNVTFIERSYNKEGISGEVHYSFKIQ